MEVDRPRPVRRVVDVEGASGFQHPEQCSNQSTTESALRQRDVFDHAAQEDQVDRADPVLHVFEVRGAIEADCRLESVLLQSHPTDVHELRIDVVSGDGTAVHRERRRRGSRPATEVEDGLVRQRSAAVLDLGDQVLDEVHEPAVGPAEFVLEVLRVIWKVFHAPKELLRPLPEFGRILERTRDARVGRAVLRLARFEGFPCLSFDLTQSHRRKRGDFGISRLSLEVAFNTIIYDKHPRMRRSTHIRREAERGRGFLNA